jgi:hypothetical protein
MRHCHFSILWNEMAFLKQKLPFLYRHFDQLIFFDLNITTFKFSDDGGHEFIKNYPDPEKKIILIEKTDLSDVMVFTGRSSIEKQKMFAAGSKYVKDNIDVFWCTDLDEFFCESLIKKVEAQILQNARSILLPHLVFIKNEEWVVDERVFPWPRIAVHKKGNLYGHCNLLERFPPAEEIKDEVIFHFGWVGDERVRFKCKLLPAGPNFLNEVWIPVTENILDIKADHVVIKGARSSCVIKKNTRKLPEYINIDEMMKDLKVR